MSNKLAPLFINGETITVSSDGRIWRESGREASKINNGLGYLRARVNKKDIMVHRLVWEAFNGPIPAGMQIDHIDFNKANNALTNLRVVTQSENSQSYHDMLRRKGIPCKRGGKRVGLDNALLIRRLHADGYPKIKLAAMFGITREGVRHIVSGRSYKNAA